MFALTVWVAKAHSGLRRFEATASCWLLGSRGIVTRVPEPHDLTRYSALEFGFLFAIGFALAVTAIGSIVAIVAFRLITGH
jgi:hypothetical protein